MFIINYYYTNTSNAISNIDIELYSMWPCQQNM